MIQKIKKYINKSEFVSNSLTLFTGTTVAQIIPLLISPVLARLYTPEDFGILALYMSFAAVAAVFATGRYELAIMLPEKNKDAVNVFSLSVFTALFVSLIISVTIISFHDEIVSWSENDRMSFILYFLPLSVFSLGLYKSLNYWFNRNDKFKNIAVSKVVATSSNSAVSLASGIAGKNSYGLVFGWIFGQFSSMLFLVLRMFKNYKDIFKYVSVTAVKASAIRYKKFPLFDIWSELLNVLSVQLPIVIITKFFGESITGYYSFAYKILLVPFSLLAFSMGQAFFKKANDLKNEGKDVGSFTFGVFKKLLLISIIPLVITGMFGDIIFPFVFGKEWIIAGKYSRFFSLWIFAVFISSPLTNLFAVFERQRTSLVFNIIMFVIRMSILIVVSLKTNDSYEAIFLYAISGFILRFLYLLLIVKIAGVNLMKIFFEIFKYAVPAIFISYFLRMLLLRIFT